jgi:hypothetical protein
MPPSSHGAVLVPQQHLLQKLEHRQQLQGLRQQPQQQQGPQQHQQQARAAVPTAYAELLGYCDMCARSSSMVDWVKGEQQQQQQRRQ